MSRVFCAATEVGEAWNKFGRRQALYINYGPAELLEWPIDQRQKHPWQKTKQSGPVNFSFKRVLTEVATATVDGRNPAPLDR